MPVAEITPVGQDLVIDIEVSIEEQHIDRVHIGQLSRVKFIFWVLFFFVFSKRPSPKSKSLSYFFLCVLLWCSFSVLLKDMK